GPAPGGDLLGVHPAGARPGACRLEHRAALRRALPRGPLLRPPAGRGPARRGRGDPGPDPRRPPARAGGRGPGVAGAGGRAMTRRWVWRGATALGVFAALQVLLTEARFAPEPVRLALLV